MDIDKLREILDKFEIIDNKLIIQDELTKIITFLKDFYNYNILKNITAIDNGENIELIYHLYNIEDDENLLISISVKEEIESISKIFDSAVADEKEIFDLFGIKFIGNNELKRLYLPESWNGHPLKKDYQENDERLSWND
ncbi:NADH-quinone oxidoreductase subunit C [bacterium]|nr:NADH-quinone oxidoreductase subunit C [bacterium]